MDTTRIPARRRSRPRTRSSVLALVVLWSRTEPDRVGEIVLIEEEEGKGSTLGRGASSGGVTLALARQRPGGTVATGPLRSSGISREQWCVRRTAQTLEVENCGKRDLLHNGARVDVARARAGDFLEIGDEVLFLVARRPFELVESELPPALMPPFGEADAFGIVGESPMAWELRRNLAFAAGREDHVLITGPSGAGKELAAQVIHRLSRRAAGPWLARNAATLPEGLIDAELFGNVRDYPNPGMAERTGVIGSADGGTLLLDEIGELSHTLQAHMLRVIELGEYQRLGDARMRRADVRIVAATNRDPSELKHDLLGRLRLRVQVPGLEQRREDIPLIARHLLQRMAKDDPPVAERVFRVGDRVHPDWSANMVRQLTAADYATQVRELHAQLWQAISQSDGGQLTARSWQRAADEGTAVGSETAMDAEAILEEAGDRVERLDPTRFTPEQIMSALAACRGSREQAWRVLGLRSRHQLVRLMRHHGIRRIDQISDLPE